MGFKMSEENFPSKVPSEASALLRSLIGQRLVGLVRYSWWPASKVSQECGISSHDDFSLTAGPLALTFNGGQTLGISSEPSLASITVWQDRDAEGHATRKPTLDHDSELFSIGATSPEFSRAYWAALINSTLNSVVILHRKPFNALHADMPREVGLIFQFENGKKLLATHGLHDDSDDFAVIKSDQIVSTLVSELESRTLV
jgi:hypothetical protein